MLVTALLIITIKIGIITVTVLELYLWKLVTCSVHVVMVKVEVKVKVVGTTIITSKSTRSTNNVMVVITRASKQVGHRLILACIAAEIIGIKIAAINSSISD